MDKLLIGIRWVILALVGYSIYEWISGRWLRRKQFRTLVENLKFPEEVSSYIWKKSKGKIGQLVGYDKDGEEKFVNGLEITKANDNLLADLRTGLPKNYLAFICYFNKKIKNLGILKSTDKYLILKTMQTNGEDYGLSNHKLVNGLKIIDKKYPFSIIGAGNDWLELDFEALPDTSGESIEPLLDRLMELMPSQNDLAECKIELEEELRTTNKIFFWWPAKSKNAENLEEGKEIQSITKSK